MNYKTGHLLLLLLCHTAAPAPQAMTDSDITYVKLQPPIEAPTAPSHYRESRIENLPLTIPGNITSETSKNKDETVSINSDETNTNYTDDFLPESTNLSESIAFPEKIDKTEPEVAETTELPENGKQEQTASEILPETTAISKPDEVEPDKTEADPKPDSTERDELLEAHGSDLSDTIPSETYQSERRGRTYDSSETTDIFEEITERFEDITQIPEIVAPRTKPPPKFSKSSYFKKPKPFSFPKNSIEKSPLRRFRSHCRCEKIWNCPKLQISVPRCPDEYFLCCF